MATRAVSAGAGSTGSSNGDIPVFTSQNQNKPHPEEWTLPHEWSIEKREMFQNWKMDIQNQIANLAGNLEKSLCSNPHPCVGDEFDYSDTYSKAEFDKFLQRKEREVGNTLLYGLARVQHPQKQ